MNTENINREQWLNRAITEIRVYLTERLDRDVPSIRVSVGFPGGNRTRRVIGQCWATTASEDGVAQVFVHPSLVHPVTVLEVLVHEMVHAIDDCEHGHRGPFVRMAKAAGLEGKITATKAGPELEAVLGTIAERLGDYPHAALVPNQKRRASATRMLKISCPACGYTARTTKKWLDVGVPVCPCGTSMQGDQG